MRDTQRAENVAHSVIEDADHQSEVAKLARIGEGGDAQQSRAIRRGEKLGNEIDHVA